ncbi:hypothetical protein PIB30_026196 [Stylosanthes scabra]|uniref:Uncharacterized protein n=1 Tax=Stylosanthes scabra TaxID=79078 RepID=A0ABU6Y7M1_9FABA|nr:hypothetical protein [Stylosanthes scabra]
MRTKRLSAEMINSAGCGIWIHEVSNRCNHELHHNLKGSITWYMILSLRHFTLSARSLAIDMTDLSEIVDSKEIMLGDKEVQWQAYVYHVFDFTGSFKPGYGYSFRNY